MLSFFVFVSSDVFALSLDRDNSLRVNYTVPPRQLGVSGVVSDNTSNLSYYYKSVVSGGMHDFLKDVVKDSAIDVNYIPYDSYSQALQNSKIYSEDRPEVIVGITYDENNLKYLEYLPYPVFVDYLVVVADSRFLPAGFKPTKRDVEDTILRLSSVMPIVQVEDKKLPLLLELSENLILVKKRTVDEAMDFVVSGNGVLVATNSDVQYFLDNNKGKNNVQNLVVYKYPKFNVNYFIAINKKSNLYVQRYNDEMFFIDKLKQNVESVLKKISKVSKD